VGGGQSRRQVQRLFIDKGRESGQAHVRAFVERAVMFQHCSACDGSRLNDAARSATVHGRTIAECSAMQISDLACSCRALEFGPLSSGEARLTLGQPLNTLCVGERQRIKLANHIAGDAAV
jgi:excinuclease UvrABC ATPase subunit